MTQEEFNNEVNLRLTVHDEKFNAFLREMQDFKQEMRQQNQLRAAENEEIRQMTEAKNAEMRQSIKEIYQATDAKISEIRQAIDGMGKHVRNISYATIAAVGAMVVTVLLNLPK